MNRNPIRLTSIFLFLVLVFLLSSTGSSHALSITPKQVTKDITGFLNSTTGYRDVNVLGKNFDDTSISYEYFNQRYGITRWESIPPAPDYFGSNYSGASNYLVLAFFSNGLGGIGNYAAGSFTLKVDGHPFKISIPSFSFTTQSDYFSLYVADDGSTFYANAAHQPFGGEGLLSALLQSSVNLTPSEAFSVKHLAAAVP